MSLAKGGRLPGWASLALVLGLAGVLLSAALGQASLERAEVYFVDAARAMVERGDWLVPYYRGEPFFDKPPLTYWLIAGAFTANGFTLGTARLVPALAGLLALAAAAWLGSLLFDARTGRLGALLLATTPAFLSFGRIAMADMLLTLASTLAFALGVRLLARPGPTGPLPLALALAATLGLGFLAKGPIALVLPGLGLALLGWRFRERLRAMPAGAAALFALAFLVVAAPWFALVWRRLGLGPLEYFFLHENLERFAGETYDSGRPALFYLGIYATQGLPWSPFLLPALVRLFGRRAGEPNAEGAGARLLAGWVALMLVPLSLSHGKIDYYLLPAYPPLSLLVARFLRESWTPAERALARAVLLCAALLLAAAPQLAAGLPAAWLPAPAAQALARMLALVAAAALAWEAFRLRPARAVGALAAAAAVAFLATVALYVPALRRAQPNTEIVADVMRERRFRPDAQLVLCEDPTRVARDLLFEARTAVLERCDLWAPAASRLPFLLLLEQGQRETLRSATRFVGEYRYVPGGVTTLTRLMAPVAPGSLVLLANYPTADPEADRRVRKDRKRRVQQRERLQATEGAAVP